MSTIAATTLELSRVQFALTTLYHFVFVPLTLGLAPLLAIMQTKAYRTGDERWERLVRFFGVIFLVNFAVGAATGLVQEFQFGMNWSGFSTFVGDVFGAPIALEGLGAFFLESTFIGLWVFGRDRLKPKVHLLTIYLVWAGTWLSAYFIIASNSWMQHPVGYELNAAGDRAQANDMLAILFQPFAIVAWGHAILAGMMVGGFLVLGVSAWHLWRGRNADLFALTARLTILILIPVTALNLVWGSEFGVFTTDVQPMKIAATEALWDTEQPAAFSLFQIGGFSASDQTPSFAIEVPRLLSFLSTNSFNGQVVGINELQSQYEQQFGPGNYTPNVAAVYWAMRVMAYLGTLSLALALWGGWLLRKGRLATATWFHRAAVAGIALPFISALAGWVLTETGRQPWVVWGLLKTEDAVSNLPASSVAISLTTFMLLYLALAVTNFVLIRHYARLDPPPAAAEAPPQAAPEPRLGY
jgi:cytochrome d ubiquinol oxidase subunit I